MLIMMLKLILASLIAHNRLSSFSGQMALASQCWFGTWLMQRTWLELMLTTTASTMMSHTSLCNLARCLMPPCSHNPTPMLGQAPRGTVMPAAMVLQMISPVLQLTLMMTKEPQSVPESPPSFPTVRMCIWLKVPMSTKTTLSQRQWLLWPLLIMVRLTLYFRAHWTYCWMCQISVDLIIAVGW